jgi:hypothetical protein
VKTIGIRVLENFLIKTGLEETFAEIIALSAKYKYNNCAPENKESIYSAT